MLVDSLWIVVWYVNAEWRICFFLAHGAATDIPATTIWVTSSLILLRICLCARYHRRVIARMLLRLVTLFRISFDLIILLFISISIDAKNKVLLTLFGCRHTHTRYFNLYIVQFGGNLEKSIKGITEDVG